MNIIIRNTKEQPIYEQICEQMKTMIITGQLKEGDPLPSMRLLAKELRISVITTKRAYEELEREGFIVSITGKGSFVAGANVDFIMEERLKKVEKLLAEAVEEGRVLGLSLQEITEMLTLLYEEE